MKQVTRAIALAASVLCCSVASVVAQELPEYRPAPLEAGSLTSIGSDSMGELMDVWVAAYRARQPEVQIQTVSRGSASAPPALIEGRANLGPMARPMKSAEREEFIQKYGFEPTQVRAAIAAVGVYLPESNPLTEISFEQLEQIYADGENGEPSAHPRWSDLGVKDRRLAKQEVMPIGRHAEYYLHGYFRQQVLRQKPLAPQVLTTADSSSLLQAIRMNPASIGFGEVVERNLDGVKLVAVKRSASDRAVLPSHETITDQSYPLTRYLNIYVVREPGEPLDPALTDFLRFVLSKEGQTLVAREGLTPLPGEVLLSELSKLQ